MKDLFKKIIIERQEWLQSIQLINRELEIEKNANYAFIGLRRAGKSYLLYQVAKTLFADVPVEQIVFINFEDERLVELTHNELHQIVEAHKELFDSKPIFFLDEIQNVSNWQKFVRRLADEGYRVYISGSNAKMLSHEIATTLGGRFINKEIMPLSFQEYLHFNAINYTQLSAYKDERFDIIRAFETYFQFGGFPELIQLKDKREFLSNVYQRLFYGDIIARNSIQNVQLLKILIKKLAESVNNETSVNRIKNLIKSTGISIGNNTLFEYLRYLEDAFMIGSISNFTSKDVERETAKKYYFMDNGFVQLFLNDQDTKLLENMIYLELRRRKMEIYFFKRITEVDFYIPDKNMLIQVAYSISDIETEKREVKALQNAMKELTITDAIIITHNEWKEIETKYGSIHVVPAWKWLLNLS